MNYEIKTCNLRQYRFECKENPESNCRFLCVHNCNKNEKIICYTNNIKEQIRKDCIIRNFIKWYYRIKKANYIIRHEEVTVNKNIIKYRNEITTIEQIKNDLKDEYEIIDENELNNIIKSTTERQEYNIKYENKKCAKCNDEFEALDQNHQICKKCYKELKCNYPT